MKQKKPAPFNNPFSSLKADFKKQLKEERKAAAAPPPPPPPPPPEPEVDQDEALFMAAMRGTRALDPARAKQSEVPERVVARPPPPTVDQMVFVDEDADVMAELSALVEGRVQFDIEDSDEFVEGAIEGLDRRIMKKLRKGEYAVQDHLDLHGLTREPARAALEAFMAKARGDGLRCVLVVHGRGLNSKDNVPVLKGLLKVWLERGRFAQQILAFSSARPHDGGTGAMYVLLRRG